LKEITINNFTDDSLQWIITVFITIIFTEDNDYCIQSMYYLVVDVRKVKCIRDLRHKIPSLDTTPNRGQKGWTDVFEGWHCPLSVSENAPSHRIAEAFVVPLGVTYLAIYYDRIMSH